ncbi:CHRD domain-containing protein [Dyadobacter sp. CY312]|uniref:CHRD domain-containing protein n=1 Tax=Dyadobacter sp. CY312 TaxID=2907303 RepID=UPI001F2C3CBF|nr:CHRD domain-containing protein [Dyadobacter sp. CY312]MCE7040524.1 CHRD domain-containing protein [Dyadobacter sp. CY312]
MNTFMKRIAPFLMVLVVLGCSKDHTPEDVVKRIALPISADQEVPAKNSTGSGSADVYYNKVTHMLTFTMTWQNISDIPTGAHIHGPAARGANAGIKYDFFSAFPKTASGTFSSEVLVDGSKIDEAQLLAGMYYFNIHTKNNPGGEIRGQIEF